MYKYLFGIFIILIGVYFMLMNFGVDIGVDNIVFDYWPVILIVIGLKIIIEVIMKYNSQYSYPHRGQIFWGLLIFLVGLVFLGNNLEWFNVNIWNIIWPLALIIMGFEIIFGGKWSKNRIARHHGSKSYQSDNEKEKHWFGEFKYGEGEAWNLDDIKMWHGAGEVKIDLTRAIIPEREVFIDISGWAGEIKVFVPHDLPISVYGEVSVGEVKIFDEEEQGIRGDLSYISSEYSEAVKKVNMSFSLTVGQVVIKRVY